MKIVETWSNQFKNFHQVHEDQHICKQKCKDIWQIICPGFTKLPVASIFAKISGNWSGIFSKKIFPTRIMKAKERPVTNLSSLLFLSSILTWINNISEFHFQSWISKYSSLCSPLLCPGLTTHLYCISRQPNRLNINQPNPFPACVNRKCILLVR